MRFTPWIFSLLFVSAACGQPGREVDTDKAATMDAVAEQYVQLVLAVGQHDADYVDAYYGPDEWKIIARATDPALPVIARKAAEQLAILRPLQVGDDPMIRLRHRFLVRQLESLASRVEMLSGTRMSFEDEAEALYDARPPRVDISRLEKTLKELGETLPGSGSLIERYQAFQKKFVIPSDKLDAVFSAAIAECRRRTKEHIELPERESFKVEYVTDQPWSAYNWYKGDAQSLIQVNTDLPVTIDRAVDLACHEGYPGHHVYNVLLEDRLVLGRGWVEYMAYPLFSPMSLIAEGTANYGIEVAFPDEERLAFEREKLYPLAGLDPAQAAAYSRLLKLRTALDYAGNEAARRYLDGEASPEEAAGFLTRYAMMPPERARQRVRFIDKYRSYVINYNLGRDLVRHYVESHAAADDASPWDVFAALISSPRLPSGLAD